jgi:phospholipase C
MGKRITRRQFLVAAEAATVGAAFSGDLLDRALAASAAIGSSASEIKHVVMLMQENRSFDHYFGTMSGVRGFADSTRYQSYPGGPRTQPATIYNQSTLSQGSPLVTIPSRGVT